MRWPGTVVGLLVCAYLAWTAPGAAARTVDAEDLVADLEAIAEGDDVDLAGVDAVRLDGGEVVPFDPGMLDASTSRADAADQVLAALDSLDTGNGAAVDTERARTIARSVVDELDLEPEPPDQDPRGPSSSPFGALGQLLGYLVLAAALVGLAFAIAAMVRSISRRRRGEIEEAPEEVPTATGVLDDSMAIDALTAQEWTDRAAAAEQDGRYGEAVRYLHYAGLLRLDEDGSVPYERSRTNGDYVRVTSRLAPDSTAGLRDLNRLMEDATFGAYPMDPGAVAATRTGWQRLREALAGTGGDRQL